MSCKKRIIWATDIKLKFVFYCYYVSFRDMLSSFEFLVSVINHYHIKTLHLWTWTWTNPKDKSCSSQVIFPNTHGPTGIVNYFEVKTCLLVDISVAATDIKIMIILLLLCQLPRHAIFEFLASVINHYHIKKLHLWTWTWTNPKDKGCSYQAIFPNTHGNKSLSYQRVASILRQFWMILSTN